MVGGGNRRDEGSFTVSNTNVFAALDSLRKKKKSDKEKGLSKGGKGTSKDSKGAPQAEKQVYWAPTPLTSKSWADIDDEDDDDYYATNAPPQVIWGASGSSKAEETQKHDSIEESESEDDLLDEGDDDVDDEHDPEPEAEEQPQPVLKNPVESSPAPKEPERQLSKKERKKKELAELEAILADFGVNPKEKAGDDRSDSKDRKEGQTNGDAEKDNVAPGESKSAKKKKKKDKSSKETKEPQDQPNEPDKIPGAEHADEDSSTVDVKEKLKKMASVKKKKSGKEMDAAARAAAVEAAARSARLAAAKKKEKNHYNQQPIRAEDLSAYLVECVINSSSCKAQLKVKADDQSTTQAFSDLFQSALSKLTMP
ncbi:Unknown protein [Striga hermonthica]|uniref:Uncharacterized protein n=1 Tax=Striga hermonthica TaxID=68872 RepID=A0A9N7N2P6_STRHE|nr:Unknown protein [Striga hermonthica]